MEATKENDYAVAKALNGLINAMIMYVFLASNVGMAEDKELVELNRSYVLLANELEKIYNRNPELSAIKAEPLWKRFDVLKTSISEILDYIDETDDFGLSHNARVEKLCIIAGVETPTYSEEQKKLIDTANAVIKKYGNTIDKVNVERIANEKNNWQIPEYTLAYKPDGTILINDVLKLKKAHAGSTTERLLEQALRNPNTLFKPDLGQTSRNLSTVLGSAGFTSELRELFFPTVSKANGVVFRPAITRELADNDRIDTSALDLHLKALGAKTEPKST